MQPMSRGVGVQAKVTTMRALTGSRIGGYALMAGGIAFASFWGSIVVDLEIPWMISLGMHGSSIILISVGLINVQHATASSQTQARLGWASVALTLVGLATVVPLLAIGLALFGASLLVSRRWVSGGAMIVGSLAFLAVYVFGSHIGDEGAPNPSPELGAVFGVALVLIAAGLVLTGYRRIRSARGPIGSALDGTD
jgi:hypothetical protein